MMSQPQLAGFLGNFNAVLSKHNSSRRVMLSVGCWLLTISTDGAEGRDLAEQTHKCFQAYSKHLTAPALTSVLLVGGLDPGPQLKVLKAGAEIVVGTPGRIIDFVESGKLPLDKVRVTRVIGTWKQTKLSALLWLPGRLSTSSCSRFFHGGGVAICVGRHDRLEYTPHPAHGPTSSAAAEGTAAVAVFKRG